MKLAKKLFAVVMALALVSCFGFAALAEEVATTEAPTTAAPTEAPTTAAPTEAPTTAAPTTAAPTLPTTVNESALTIKFAATNAAVGQEVQITVSLLNSKGVSAGNIFFSFDKTVLEFVKAEEKAPAGASGVVANIGNDGNASIALMCLNALTEETNELAVFTFKVLKAGNAGIKVVSANFSDADGKTVPEFRIVGDNITVGEAATTTAVTTTAPTGTGKPNNPPTGDAGLAVAAGLVVLAGAAFVLSKKRK